MSNHAYYNEIDDYAAEWLENLVRAGHIAPGVVDRRSIVDVRPADLAEFTQCHFFAGVGVWSLALRQAGWRDDQRVWTGSCPCQPFSTAGKGAGFDDERHLWPAWHYLIGECRPPVIVGEQVASKDALEWWDLVQADLEAEGYAAGAGDLCAAGIGAPHIRQRLWWVGYADQGRSGRHAGAVLGAQSSAGRRMRSELDGVEFAGAVGELADAPYERERANQSGRDRGYGEQLAGAEPRGHSEHDGAVGELAYSGGAGLEGRPRAGGADECVAGPCGLVGGLADDNGLVGAQRRAEPRRGDPRSDALERPGLGGCGVAGFWANAEWIPCRDGKWRPVEPGTFPLAHGAPARVGRLRAYGNAIVAPLAAEWVRVVMECQP